MSVGDNDRRSKCFCSIAVTFRKFYVQIFNTHLIRLRVTEGPNMNDQIESCAFHSFFNRGSPNKILAAYMRCMHNNNLEIRIAGSSCRIVFNFFWDLQFIAFNNNDNMLEPGGQQRVIWYFLKKAYSSKLPTLSSFMATLKACSGRSADLQKHIKTLHSWTQHNVKTF